ncbi:MAG TPA: GGDEF domain-containing protein [Pseudolabrys sp.]|nr:GGDEF domain-containing protein [Pseudolabrys sp.]
MLLVSAFPPPTLDVPTLSFVAVCIATVLGLFLIFTWLQQRNIRALAWWGAAYLVGAASMALWSAPVSLLAVPPELPSALIFIACGMIWNGVRLFQGRRLLPFAAFAGAMVWLVVCRFPAFAEGSNARIVLGGAVVASYTFWIAFEFGRERRKSLYSPAATVLIPGLHAGIFLLPLGMRTFLPDVVAASWLTIFALETIIYGVGAAFMVLMMVQDRQVHYYRNAATTDFLTKLPNRRAFREGACALCDHQARRNGPVTLLMFDLDHFKHINDQFGHATGDEALRVFAQAVRSSMRAGDLVARIGGEEFAAIVPASRETAATIAERVRASFEAAGETIDGKPLGATVSIGAATSHGPAAIDALFSHADAALYTAKELGRNRTHIVEVESLPARDVAIAVPTLPQPLISGGEKTSEAPLTA